MNEDDFESFFVAIRPTLVGYAQHRLDIESAHDVALQTLHIIWLKNLEAPTSQDDRRRLFKLTFKILDGQINNTKRAHRRYLRLISTVQDDSRIREKHAPDPADVLADELAPTGVLAAIAQLSSAERQVLSMVIEGYRVNEIAATLGVTPGSISMRLTRARRNLKAHLGRGQADEKTGKADVVY